jgi:cytochrome b6-f complex iron-sulfur subunit
MNCPDTASSSLFRQSLKRRALLQYLWAIPLATAGLQFLGMVERFGFPRKNPGTFGAVLDVGSLAELPEVGGRPIHHSRGRLWLINSEEGLVAISHTCSHLECLFDWDTGAGCFVCPCHGSQFDRFGRVLAGPATKGLDRFPLRIVAADGTSLAETDPIGNPLPLLPVKPVPVSEGGAEKAPRLLVDTSRKIIAEGQHRVL